MRSDGYQNPLAQTDHMREARKILHFPCGALEVWVLACRRNAYPEACRAMLFSVFGI
jgi:hypothetical protein